MNIPAGISEAELLALVEGEAVAPERVAAVNAALAADAGLARAVEAMRRDRAAITASGAIKAPAGLLEGVEAMLEREALLALSPMEPMEPAEVAAHRNGHVSSHMSLHGAAKREVIPVSRVQPRGRSVIATIGGAGRWMTRPSGLAMAAAVALAAGATLLVMRGHTRASAGGAGESGAAIAAKPAGTEQGGGDAGHGVNAGGAHEPVKAIAADDHGPAKATPGVQTQVTPGTNVATGAAVKPTDAGDAKPGTGAATTPTVARAETGMSIERALALAGQGRLVIRVKAADAEQAGKVIETIAARAARKPVAERMSVADAASVTSAVLRQQQEIIAARAPKADKPAGTGNETPPVVASGDPHVNVPGPVGPGTGSGNAGGSGPVATPPTLASAGYRVSIVAEEPALAAVLRALKGGGAGNALSGVELDELPRPIASTPPVDEKSVLWWGQPSGAWARRVSVPVVIQTSP